MRTTNKNLLTTDWTVRLEILTRITQFTEDNDGLVIRNLLGRSFMGTTLESQTFLRSSDQSYRLERFSDIADMLTS